MSLFQVIILAASALLIGIGKTSVPFFTMAGLLLMPLGFSVSASVPLVLLLYIPADIIAVIIYRRFRCFRVILPVIPFLTSGILLASLVAKQLPEKLYAIILGSLLLAVTIYNISAELTNFFKLKKESGQFFWLRCALFGIISGFSSMLGNVGGPFIFLYLLSFALDRWQTVAAIVWIFTIANQIKLLFHILYQHTISAAVLSIPFVVVALPAVAIGGLLGITLLGKINEKIFRIILLAASLWGGVSLIIRGLV